MNSFILAFLVGRPWSLFACKRPRTQTVTTFVNPGVTQQNIGDSVTHVCSLVQVAFSRYDITKPNNLQNDPSLLHVLPVTLQTLHG